LASSEHQAADHREIDIMIFFVAKETQAIQAAFATA
tara:strand:- start:80741 stop:80848 length:108 start_codon:yes stop_codon:yes gene_type:complete